MANSFLDPFLGWILNLEPVVGILAISIIVSFIITIAIKMFTDQSLMKDLRSELKELQKQLKELKNNPKKMAKVNTQFMETNMKYMSHSMRPTMFTFIPIILVFGWLNSHIAYLPLLPDEPFEVTALFDDTAEGMVSIEVPEELELFNEVEKEITRNAVTWSMKGPPGDYMLKVNYNDKSYEKQVFITTERRYAPVEKSFRTGFLFFKSSDEGFNSIKLNNEKIQPFKTVPVMKDIPWVGNWGWLGAYFLFSIIFSMGFRRVMKIY